MTYYINWKCALIYPTKVHFKHIINVENCIQRVFNELDLKILKITDQIKNDQSYYEAIIRWIAEVDFCLVILDALRPNVIFELGVAKGLKKPTIIICGKSATISAPTLYRDFEKDSCLTPQMIKRFKNSSIDLDCQFSDRGSNWDTLFYDYDNLNELESLLHSSILNIIKEHFYNFQNINDNLVEKMNNEITLTDENLLLLENLQNIAKKYKFQTIYEDDQIIIFFKDHQMICCWILSDFIENERVGFDTNFKDALDATFP